MIYQSLFYILAAAGDLDLSTLPNSGTDDAPSSVLSTVFEIVFATTAAIALLMIVISGLRYILAAGDSGKVANARNTILYSIIGLIVSATAYSIVRFVIGNV